MSAVRYAVGAFALILFAVACSGDSSSVAGVDRAAVRTAKLASTDMSVTGAVPDSATQDTTLDVVINGSGFVTGTVANWALAGVQDPAQVRTNSTRYVNSRQLVANITISSSATVAKWDIVVTAAGKGGIGTELFAIKTKPNADNNSRANYVVANQVNVAPAGQPDDWRPSGVRGDGRLKNGAGANGGDSEYQGEYCGANGVIFNGNVNTSQNSGDLNIAPDGRYGNYCGTPRYFDFYLSGSTAAPVSSAAATRVAAIWWMNVGESASRAIRFSLHVSGCDDLSFDDAYPPSQNVRVTRLPDLITTGGSLRQWKISTQGNHMATCLIQKSLKQRVAGASYFMPFSIIVTDVPYPAPSYP